MKKLSLSALAFATAFFAVTAAHADTTPGWYVGAGLGASFAAQDDIKVPGVRYHGDYDPSVGIDGNVGYAWANGLRLEGEYFHNQLNLDKIKGHSNASGHILNNDAFANVLYDIGGNYLGSRVTPYVGVGVGADWADVRDISASGIGRLNGDDNAHFAYQGIAGVATNFDPNWAVMLDYRYVGSTDPKVGYSTGGQGRVDNASHNIMLGVRYSFGQPEAVAPMHAATAPMVAPKTAEQPPIAAVPQSFTVFFDFNKSVLTPEAKRILASAAQEYKRGGYVSIKVTGHTDTVGSVVYNQKLSERRAEAVDAELSRLGVAGSSIKEVGVGKNDLLVPTADGVREAQNRRAEIVLTK
jgi:OOP family OmpA-OmpF porin